jgi:hypothetical protein
MARKLDLEKVAVRLARILGPDDCLLVGGLAVGAHGYVRATKDVDFIVNTSLEIVVTRLRKRGISGTLRRGDPREGDFPCVKGTVDGIPFDIMPPLVPLDWGRAAKMPMGRGVTLRVVDLEGLIRLKLRAQGPRDLLDVAALVLQHPEQLDLVREMAVAYRVADKLEVWLKDPRLNAELLDVRKQRSRPARRRKAQSPH